MLLISAKQQQQVFKSVLFFLTQTLDKAPSHKAVKSMLYYLTTYSSYSLTLSLVLHFLFEQHFLLFPSSSFWDKHCPPCPSPVKPNMLYEALTQTRLLNQAMLSRVMKKIGQG